MEENVPVLQEEFVRYACSVMKHFMRDFDKEWRSKYRITGREAPSPCTSNIKKAMRRMFRDFGEKKMDVYLERWFNGRTRSFTEGSFRAFGEMLTSDFLLSGWTADDFFEYCGIIAMMAGMAHSRGVGMAPDFAVVCIIQVMTRFQDNSRIDVSWSSLDRTATRILQSAIDDDIILTSASDSASSE